MWSRPSRRAPDWPSDGDRRAEARGRPCYTSPSDSAAIPISMMGSRLTSTEASTQAHGTHPQSDRRRRSAASSRATSSSSASGRSGSTWSSSGWRPPTGRSGTCSSGRTTRSCRTSPPPFIILFTPIFFIFAVLDLQDRPAPREDRRGLGAEPGRGGAPRRGRVDPSLPVMRASDRRRMDHLPDLPDPPEARLPELQPAGRGWTGRCAPGAARTSSAGRSRPRPSRRCRRP